MIILAWFLWIAIWGVSGYFTVRAIQNRIEYRRIVKQLNEIQKSHKEVNCALKRDL